MRTALLAVSLLLCAAPAFAADSIAGDWLTPDGGSKVNISACASNPDQMCGVVSWLRAAKSKG